MNIAHVKYSSIALAILVLGAPAFAAPAGEAQSYPEPDTLLGERLFPDEPAIAQELGDVIEETVRKQYSNGSARRDAHPKAHGCVKAEFHVEDKLESRLAKGIFIPGKTYEAWVRFSNGNPDPTKPDFEGQERGMSIKVLGVPGEKILESERQDTTQDFVMMSHPVFFVKDPAKVVPFFKELGSDSIWGKLQLPFTLGLSDMLTLLEINRLKISNPLQTRYWSPTPYQLGLGPDRMAIKFSAMPCGTTVDPMPDQPGPDFLRQAMKDTLTHGDACMNFMIQPRTSDKMDVEDAKTRWEEADAPFYKVAIVRIPQQDFDSPEQHAFCENLSFTPWHALPDHKPLGSINRVRKVVYERISSTRHAMNQVERKEP